MVGRTWSQGRLAEVIVLDPFSRNIYRRSAQALAQDTIALVLAQEAVVAGAHETLAANGASFSCRTCTASRGEFTASPSDCSRRIRPPESDDFEVRHKDIIDRFGRYPHRNTILGRVSSLEEVEFLKQPGSRF